MSNDGSNRTEYPNSPLTPESFKSIQTSNEGFRIRRSPRIETQEESNRVPQKVIGNQETFSPVFQAPVYSGCSYFSPPPPRPRIRTFRYLVICPYCKHQVIIYCGNHYHPVMNYNSYRID